MTSDREIVTEGGDHYSAPMLARLIEMGCELGGFLEGEDRKLVLRKLMKWMEDREMYELCAKCRDLIE